MNEHGTRRRTCLNCGTYYDCSTPPYFRDPVTVCCESRRFRDSWVVEPAPCVHVQDPWGDSTLCGIPVHLFEGDSFPVQVVPVSDWHDSECEHCQIIVEDRWEVAR